MAKEMGLSLEKLKVSKGDLVEALRKAAESTRIKPASTTNSTPASFSASTIAISKASLL